MSRWTDEPEAGFRDAGNGCRDRAAGRECRDVVQALSLDILDVISGMNRLNVLW